MQKLKQAGYDFLRWSEKYTKTDMVYTAQSGFWLNLNYIIGSFLSLGLTVLFAHLLPKETFGSQGDAESWIGEHWRSLLDAGVDQVTLLDDGEKIYGPMSLHPAG